ncbi:hypothetical protein RQP46_011057 [Phenoliferia psychrophenolica]
MVSTSPPELPPLGKAETQPATRLELASAFLSIELVLKAMNNNSSHGSGTQLSQHTLSLLFLRGALKAVPPLGQRWLIRNVIERDQGRCIVTGHIDGTMLEGLYQKDPDGLTALINSHAMKHHTISRLVTALTGIRLPHFAGGRTSDAANGFVLDWSVRVFHREFSLGFKPVPFARGVRRYQLVWDNQHVLRPDFPKTFT